MPVVVFLFHWVTPLFSFHDRREHAYACIRRFSLRVIDSAKQLRFGVRISRRKQQQVADFYPPSSHASARGTVAQFPRRSINSCERPKDRFTTETRGESSSSEKKLLLRFLPRHRDEHTARCAFLILSYRCIHA